MKLFPYQEACVKFHLAHNYSLNCCEPGLGKTRIALETARRAGGRILVFGPAHLKGNWHKEAKMLGLEIAYLPYSMLHKAEAGQLAGYSFWIADECHYLKSPTAQRTQAFATLLKELLPAYFLGLTGTPIRNRIQDFWTLLVFCGLNPLDNSGPRLPHPLNGYYGFSRHFCHVERMNIRGRRIDKFTGLKEERIPELKTLLQGKFKRYLVEDVLNDLPDLIKQTIPLPLKPVPGLEEAFNSYMLGRKADTVAKTTSALLKAPLTLEYCKGLIEGGSGPLLIFSDHVESAKLIASGIKDAMLITGSTNMDLRHEMVEVFQAGASPAIVATIGSMSTGVTLTAARHVVLNDLSWTPSDNEQAIKRIHRIGQKNACVAHYIVSNATDEYIYKMLNSKENAIRKAVD